MSRPVGAIVWRNPAHPLTTATPGGEKGEGVTLRHRGVVQAQNMPPLPGDYVIWDGVKGLFYYSGTSDWLLDSDPAAPFSNMFPVSLPAVPALQWIQGARVRRTAERFDSDSHFDISYLEQGTITQVGDFCGSPAVWVCWDSRGEGRPALSYLRDAGCLALISGLRVNAVITACTTCGKPFPYEAPPSGVCAECTMIRGML